MLVNTYKMAAVAALGFVACKKDRTCTCTTTGTGFTSTDVTVIYKAKKGEAREWCLGGQTTTTTSAGGSSTTTVGNTTTCELK